MTPQHLADRAVTLSQAMRVAVRQGHIGSALGLRRQLEDVLKEYWGLRKEKEDGR